MKLIPSSELKRILDSLQEERLLLKDFPVFYIGETVLKSSYKIGSDNNITSDNAFESMPFDRMIVITESTEKLSNVFIFFERGGVIHFSYNRENSTFISSVKRIQELHDKENLTQDKVNEFMEDIQHVAIVSLLPFAVKKTRIIMAEGKTIKHGSGNKKKSKKQKYLTLSTNVKVYQKNNPSHRVYDSMIATSVCGHWRHYQDENTIGHDRHGELINGKTWIAPYVKGEGQVLEEKIRMFIK